MFNIIIHITNCEKFGTGGVKKADCPMVGRGMLGDPCCKGIWSMCAFCSVGWAALFTLFLRGPRSAWTALKYSEKKEISAACKLYTQLQKTSILPDLFMLTAKQRLRRQCGHQLRRALSTTQDPCPAELMCFNYFIVTSLIA